jgi:hypothetical protein
MPDELLEVQGGPVSLENPAHNAAPALRESRQITTHAQRAPTNTVQAAMGDKAANNHFPRTLPLKESSGV